MMNKIKILIEQIIEEELQEMFATSPKFGDIKPTDQKTGERPFMDNRPKDGMDIEQFHDILNASKKEEIQEVNALAAGNVSATSTGNAWKQSEENEKQLEEETIGKSGKHGPTYFQMGGSLPDELYNRKNKKPSRDPGIAGIKKESKSKIKNLYWFHGSDYKINKFTNEYLKKESNFQEGPGIYLTSNENDAKRYGKFVYKINLKIDGKLIPKNGNVTVYKNDILKLMRMSPNYQQNLTDWNENLHYAEKEAFSNIIRYNNGPQDAFQQIWAMFYNNNPIEYTKNLTVLGYVGHIAERVDNTIHLIVYNPDILEIESVLAENKFYHGTTIDLHDGEYVLPPTNTENISEKGRKKNLDKVFFTKDLGSAKIYAGRAKQSIGGQPKIYEIEPEGEIEIINQTPGSTVFMSPRAKVIKRIM